MDNNSLDISINSFISLLEKGDRIALETLFRLYYDKLLHLAKNYLVYEEDAEEIVQNVFLKLWEQRSKLNTVTNINSYLYTMTKNTCLDHLKHEKVKKNYINSNFQDRASINHQFIKDEAASLLLENELEQKILEGLDLLPEKCKNVFMKSRMEGLKHAEIAKELGISSKTVDNHISKALKHMKFHLKDFLTIFL